MASGTIDAQAVNERGIFSPVSAGRLSEEIAEQIKAAIRDGRLRPGDRLPPERELTTRFGVSRMSVRDALRALEANGLIEVRVGAKGGAYVRVPGSSFVGEGIANMLAVASVSPGEVTEARRVIEIGIVPLVVERATDEDLRTLTGICEEARRTLREGDHRLELSAEFHLAFARAAHNAAIELLVESLRGPLLVSLERAKEAAPAMGPPGVREHIEIVRALRARDASRAEAIMSRHLGRTARRLAGSSRTGT
jgi:GntR family transcriptional regulator, transcriptional repressor for pyruvate dehydrogenase complex